MKHNPNAELIAAAIAAGKVQTIAPGTRSYSEHDTFMSVRGYKRSPVFTLEQRAEIAAQYGAANGVAVSASDVCAITGRVLD